MSLVIGKLPMTLDRGHIFVVAVHMVYINSCNMCMGDLTDMYICMSTSATALRENVCT